MSGTSLAAIVVAFLAGYGWGKVEKSVLAFIFDREEPLMRVIVKRVSQWVGRVFGHRTTVSTWTVVLSLALSSVVGGWVFLQGKEDTARTECSIEFNRLSALARDDRIAAQSAALQAQIDLLNADKDYNDGLRARLLSDHPTLEEIVSVFQGKSAADQDLIDSLTDQQAVAASHTYPPPDFCENR